MSNHRRRIDRAAAEQLLSGPPVLAQPGGDPLAQLLANAAGPARAEELKGQPAAMAAFRSARPGVTSSRWAPRVCRMLRMRALTGPVLAAVTVSAIALAAGPGIPLRHPVPTDSATVAPATKGPTTAMSGPLSTPSATPKSPAQESVVGLCQAFAAAGADRSRALDTSTFDALINKAGGRDKVDGFCNAVLATSTQGGVWAQPSPVVPTRDIIVAPSDRTGWGSWERRGPWDHHERPPSPRHHGR
jgi:hypothetical protein